MLAFLCKNIDYKPQSINQSIVVHAEHFPRKSVNFNCFDMEYVLQAYEVNTRSILSNIDSNFVPLLHQEWKNKLLSSTTVAGERCRGNKLRTYTTFKHDFTTEPYVCIVAQKKYRSAYAKFRCGVSPIKIETGYRYGANRVPPEARLCMQCSNSKMNFMLSCNAHYVMM